MYNEKLINASLSKRSLKNLILDTCQKTAMSFNNKLYDQIDEANMSGSLSPVLARILMTVCEKVIVDKLTKEKVILFYARYVDNTLLLIKKKKICFKLA